MAKKGKKRKAQNLIINLLIVICLLVGGFSAYQIISLKVEDQKAKNAYEEISENVLREEKQRITVALEASEDIEEGGSSLELTLDLQNIDFTALKELNEDVVAWLELPGTVINYPVAQGVDNDQYLRTLLDGSYHRFGTLFVDYQNAADFSDANTIIYGHHMKTGDMFGSLENYREQSYYDEHPYFLLYTPEKTYCVELFAGNLVDGSDPIPLNFASEEEFQVYINGIRSDSTFASPVKMTSRDRMVTLYTCAYDFDGARYVLRGKLVELPR